MKILQKLFWPVYFLLPMVLQLTVSNLPVHFMAFPLNVSFAALWLFGVWLLYKDYRHTLAVRFLLSSAVTAGSLVAFLSGALVIGMFPQLSSVEAAAKSGILARMGCYDFMTSWPFVFILFLLLTHLALVTCRGALMQRKNKWRFIFNHAGLWLALFAGFCGSTDVRVLRIPLVKGEANTRAYTMDGVVSYLDYELELVDFRADYYDNGMPRHYEAKVRVAADTVTLEVNHPYTYRWGEDIYLTGYERRNGSQSYCVLQVVEQPWKYVQLLGILMALVGGILLFINGPLKKNNK